MFHSTLKKAICQTLFLEPPKSLQMVIAAMKLKDACPPLKESYDKLR